MNEGGEISIFGTKCRAVVLDEEQKTKDRLHRSPRNKLKLTPLTVQLTDEPRQLDLLKKNYRILKEREPWTLAPSASIYSAILLNEDVESKELNTDQFKHLLIRLHKNPQARIARRALPFFTQHISSLLLTEPEQTQVLLEMKSMIETLAQYSGAKSLNTVAERVKHFSTLFRCLIHELPNTLREETKKSLLLESIYELVENIIVQANTEYQLETEDSKTVIALINVAIKMLKDDKLTLLLENEILIERNTTTLSRLASFKS